MRLALAGPLQMPMVAPYSVIRWYGETRGLRIIHTHISVCRIVRYSCSSLRRNQQAKALLHNSLYLSSVQEIGRKKQLTSPLILIIYPNLRQTTTDSSHLCTYRRTCTAVKFALLWKGWDMDAIVLCPNPPGKGVTCRIYRWRYEAQS